jgi:hypothetical protein
VASVLLVASLLLLGHSTFKPFRWPDCGNSPTEARNRGCKFDTLSFAWQTQECFDEDLLYTFHKYNGWKYYVLEDEVASLVPENVVREGEENMWVTDDFHFTHCTVSRSSPVNFAQDIMVRF